MNFRVAPSTLQPIVLQGLAADTQFQFAGAARPERTGTNFTSYLPVDGTVKFSWKEARPEAEGKLFYAAEMLSQISVSPGLMRQAALLDVKVMQGEMNQVTSGSARRGRSHARGGRSCAGVERRAGDKFGRPRLVVQFNQPQKDQFAMQVQMQTPLGAFPQTADAMQLRPEARRGSPAFSHRERRRGAAGSGAGERAFADFAGAIPRERRSQLARRSARRAANILRIVFPARISR